MDDTDRIPQPGDIAPDFTLPDHEGTPHRLADQRGRWVVLYFYPADDTSGCTREACDFRDLGDRIEAEDAIVWGVSPQGRESKARFRSKYGLGFPLLADEDHAVADAYGAWQERESYGRRYWGVARSTFLIDPHGRIARVWPKVRVEGHAAEVLRSIGQARAVATA